MLFYSRLFFNSLTFKSLSVRSRIEIHARSCLLCVSFWVGFFYRARFFCFRPFSSAPPRPAGYCWLLSFLNLGASVVPLSHFDKAEEESSSGEGGGGDCFCSWRFRAHPPQDLISSPSSLGLPAALVSCPWLSCFVRGFVAV